MLMDVHRHFTTKKGRATTTEYKTERLCFFFFLAGFIRAEQISFGTERDAVTLSVGDHAASGLEPFGRGVREVHVDQAVLQVVVVVVLVGAGVGAGDGRQGVEGGGGGVGLEQEPRGHVGDAGGLQDGGLHLHGREVLARVLGAWRGHGLGALVERLRRVVLVLLGPLLLLHLPRLLLRHRHRHARVHAHRPLVQSVARVAHRRLLRVLAAQPVVHAAEVLDAAPPAQLPPRQLQPPDHLQNVVSFCCIVHVSFGRGFAPLLLRLRVGRLEARALQRRLRQLPLPARGHRAALVRVPAHFFVLNATAVLSPLFFSAFDKERSVSFFCLVSQRKLFFPSTIHFEQRNSSMH